MISVIGLGYIGLPTSLAIAAAAKYQVVGIDINKDVVSSLKKNELTFQENGLQELFDKAVSNGIRFETEIMDTDTYIIAVSTPYDSISKK